MRVKIDHKPMDLMNHEITKLVNERDNAYAQMHEHFKLAEQMRCRAEEIDNVLRKKCSHVWERDYSCCVDDIYKRVCTVCGARG